MSCRVWFFYGLALFLLSACPAPDAPSGASSSTPPPSSPTPANAETGVGNPPSSPSAESKLVLVSSHSVVPGDGSQVAFRVEKVIGTLRRDVTSESVFSFTSGNEYLAMNDRLPVALGMAQPNKGTAVVKASYEGLTASLSLDVVPRLPAEVPQLLAISPTLLNFGAVQPQTKHSQFIQIRNQRPEAINEFKTEVESNSWLTVTPIDCNGPLAYRQGCSLEVTVTVPAGASGEHDEILKVSWGQGYSAIPVWIFATSDTRCEGTVAEDGSLETMQLDPGCVEDGLASKLINRWEMLFPNDPTHLVTSEVGGLFRVYNREETEEELTFGLAYHSDNTHYSAFRALPGTIHTCPVRQQFRFPDASTGCSFRSELNAVEGNAPAGYATVLEE